MASEKEKEADKLMKKGNKEISPSLLDFRLKSDWEQAAPLFEKAALLYKVGRECHMVTMLMRLRPLFFPSAMRCLGQGLGGVREVRRVPGAHGASLSPLSLANITLE